ncbi:MAG: hypothetical protein H6810_12980 [Phycisphaeraceae bacterium]|nr:MAG: hypothetical protein H6810_12980 [Phycisphaeraceae bacterium]
MAAKKKPTRKKKPRDWAAMGRWTLRTLSVLLLVGAAIGATFGVRALRGLASEAMRREADPVSGSMVTVSFDWPAMREGSDATWLPDRDQAELIRAAERAAGDADPLGVGPLRDISLELAKTGWFKSPPRVRVVGPDELRVSPRWRQPAAAVRWHDQDYVISMDAEPMPPVFQPGGSNRPVILGCADGPDRRGASMYAAPWPGLDVRAGLELLKVLWRNGLGDRVAGVDVSAFRSGGPLEIVTTHQTRIVWGSAVDEWKAGEPGVDERVQRLKQLIETTGRIDGGQRRIEIHRARVEIDRTQGG